MKKHHEEGAAGMPEHEKEKDKDDAPPATAPASKTVADIKKSQAGGM